MMLFMPRYARDCPPGSVQHIIARFINREFRLIGESERTDYLARYARIQAASDWLPLGYALMSSHVHWAVIAGPNPPERWLKPLHTGVAAALNRAQGRLGPVFAGRPTNLGVPPHHTLQLIAYLHNNPVRAGVVRDPADSSWTSHRAFIGLARPPAWLDVAHVLALCGFDASPSGRLAFHEYVIARSVEGRDSTLSGMDLGRIRRQVRQQVGAAVEVTTPVMDSDGALSCGVLLPGHAKTHPRWAGDLRSLAARVAAATGVSLEEMQSQRRSPRISSARRIVLLAGERLGRPRVELATLVSISGAAASHLLHRDPAASRAVTPLAWQIAAAIQDAGQEDTTKM